VKGYKNIIWLVAGIVALLAATAAIIVFKAEIIEFFADLKKRFGAKFGNDGGFEEFEEV
jgi:uncharacterized membrane protein